MYFFQNRLPAPDPILIKLYIFDNLLKSDVNVFMFREPKKKKKRKMTPQHRKGYVCGNKSRTQLVFKKEENQ